MACLITGDMPNSKEFFCQARQIFAGIHIVQLTEEERQEPEPLSSKRVVKPGQQHLKVCGKEI
jgi:hypothetical protein